MEGVVFVRPNSSGRKGESKGKERGGGTVIVGKLAREKLTGIGGKGGEKGRKKKKKER